MLHVCEQSPCGIWGLSRPMQSGACSIYCRTLNAIVAVGLHTQNQTLQIRLFADETRGLFQAGTCCYTGCISKSIDRKYVAGSQHHDPIQAGQSTAQYVSRVQGGFSRCKPDLYVELLVAKGYDATRKSAQPPCRSKHDLMCCLTPVVAPTRTHGA